MWNYVVILAWLDQIPSTIQQLYFITSQVVQQKTDHDSDLVLIFICKLFFGSMEIDETLVSEADTLSAELL